MTGHYFFALALPDEVKQLLLEECNQIKEKYPFKKWVHHEDYHITLAFLGHAEETKLAESVRIVKKEINDFRSFQLLINNTGIFGNSKAPRILWAGVNHSESLHTLRGKVYDSCVHAGFQLETRPFNPHITLARKWNSEDPFLYASFQQYTAQIMNEFIFIADEVVLYHTHPEKTPKYEKIESFRLK
ncbi:RNA 2',3'-cyclic phosphodiesterase [Bacillus sp. FJAT-49732]|uniref:RNA 2',3'-cyclic phosphodiesterase n=1 Tax=Lederbergia citrisecunda TaxID=2833583 RepID=A0A942YKX3_9BACI|nr:RNA 2',3'-cyclic phosphodiesterase [Lederbergia citrisecunda]MBS4200057.1 RNA 2',3'-cyclic phosphodiesterase [Lederbergia citrisecunda]